MTYTTHTFAIIEGLELAVDVHPPDPTCLVKPSPVLFMVHGGGFMTGDKTSHPPAVIDYFRHHGFTVVSPNFPLAPQSTVFAQIEAVKQAWRWVHDKEGLKSVRLDTPLDLHSVSVWGGSAAAALLIFALSDKLTPSPRAMILLYPYVDLLRPQCAGSLEDLGSNKVSSSGTSLLEAQTHFGPPLQASCFSDFQRLAVSAGLIPAEDLSPNTLYLFKFAADPAAYRDAVIGHQPSSADNYKLDVLDIVARVRLPPTFVMQGTSDSVCPLSHTRELVDAARRAGNHIELLETCVNAGRHVFDFGFSDSNSAGFKHTIGRALDFLMHASKSSTVANGSDLTG